MEHLNFIKKLSLVLIFIGLLISIGNGIYLSHHEPSDSVILYKAGLLSGFAIGLTVCGAFLRLYSISSK